MPALTKPLKAMVLEAVPWMAVAVISAFGILKTIKNAIKCITEATSELTRLKMMFSSLTRYSGDLSSLGEPGHSGAWPHHHSHLRQDWVLPLRRH
jgi:hypothetical protein